MVDVFVVAILVALIRMGKLMSVYPGSAALAFAGVVILTMLSAMSFDPRLLWDNEPTSNITEQQGTEGEQDRVE
jgi:paraquat-inducible protein A